MPSRLRRRRRPGNLILKWPDRFYTENVGFYTKKDGFCRVPSRTDDPAESRTRGTTYIAEFISIKRVQIRASPSMTSEKTGFLDTGETVVVTQVDGCRMRVTRLKWGVVPVSFQWKQFPILKNSDFLLRNPDFLLRNPDFLLKNVGFIIKQLSGWVSERMNKGEGQVSKNDEFYIKNEGLCIKNEELCIENEELCIKNDEFRRCCWRGYRGGNGPRR